MIENRKSFGMKLEDFATLQECKSLKFQPLCMKK